MKTFRTYQLAITFYRSIQHLSLPSHLNQQLLRASSSIVLNLAEGNGKRLTADRKRFFQIAFGSVREVQAIFDLLDKDLVGQRAQLDNLAASTYRLLKWAS